MKAIRSLSLLLCMVAACSHQAPADRASAVAAGNAVPVRVSTRTGATTNWTNIAERPAVLAATAPCTPVVAGQLYRFVAGVDTCMQPLTAAEQSALNDPYGAMLVRNQGTGNWPSSVDSLLQVVGNQIPGIQAPVNFVLGEGSQVPPAVTPVASNRDLRYVVTWRTGGPAPSVYLSSRPDATPPIFLQIIGWDPDKNAFNYYQYISNNELTGDPDTTLTWSYAGDSTAAQAPASAGQGCFACHRNGALNMKELKQPWNNWNSQFAQIPPQNVPPAVQVDGPFASKHDAYALQETVFQPVMQQFMQQQVAQAISGGTVSNVASLLRHLITNTTVNFNSTQAVSRSTIPQQISVPNTFFLNDDLFAGPGGLGLAYDVPDTTIPWTTYKTLLSQRNYRLINTAVNDRPPTYTWAGDTFFSFFFPEPAYEDVQATIELWEQKVISKPFAAAVLMVDYPNPVFSPVRDRLLQYSAQLSTGTADGQDIPKQFATLVAEAAAAQPRCGSLDLTRCTAEQQFLAYWVIAQTPAWPTAFQTILQGYLDAVDTRLQSAQAAAAVADYMTLTTARQEQFQNYPGICNLYEFDLFLPCNTQVGGTSASMNSDGTISPQPAPVPCPTRTPNWTNPCSVSAAEAR